jgi:hypothetical protein
MRIRREVQDLVDAGPFPPEDTATEEQLTTIQLRLERIHPPVTDAEARALTAAFGPDDCYGLGWSLLHLIETAPGPPTADRSVDPENIWVRLLADRAQHPRAD